MKLWIGRNKLMLAGILFGGLAGFFYWKYIGCLTGTCAITAKPVNNSLFGAIMGGLLFSLFQIKK